MFRFIPLLALLLIPTALAQSNSDLEGAVWLLRLLGDSPVALGVFTFAIVASVKRSADRAGKTYDPWAWRGLAFVAALLGSVALYYSGAGATLALFHATGWLAVLFYAVVSGIVAIVGRDGLKTAVQWLTSGIAEAVGNTPAPVVIPDSEEARRELP